MTWDLNIQQPKKQGSVPDYLSFRDVYLTQKQTPVRSMNFNFLDGIAAQCCRNYSIS